MLRDLEKTDAEKEHVRSLFIFTCGILVCLFWKRCYGLVHIVNTVHDRVCENIVRNLESVIGVLSLLNFTY